MRTNAMRTAVVLLAMALVLAGCRFRAGTDGQRYEGAGIVFVVPIQSAQVTNGPRGIDYRSDRFTASTDGRTLIVNGKSHGPVKSGDVVTFTRAGLPSIGGAVRAPERWIQPMPAD